MSQYIRVAGLDPSMRNFGMVKGTLDITSGVFLPDTIYLATTAADTKKQKVVRKNSLDLLRAKTLFEAMQKFLRDVDFVFVEIPVGSQTARAMTSYGMCIGLLVSISHIPMIQVTPNEVKLITGNGKNATKEQMIQWAYSLYPNLDWFRRKVKGVEELTKKNEHIADAIAAVHAGLESDQFKQLMALSGLKHKP